MESFTPRASTHGAPLYPAPGDLSSQRLDLLRGRITDSILQAAGGGNDALLGEIVRAALRTFIESHADVQRAAGSVAHLMEQIGARQARRGFDAADLTASFRTALVATQKGLPLVVGDLVTRDVLLQLREDLVAYLSELQIHAHAGLVRTRRHLAMSPDERRGQFERLTFGIEQGGNHDEFACLDPYASMVAIVSLTIPIPATLHEHPRTIRGPSPYEILVPESWDVDEVALQLAGPAVVGPAAPVLQAAEALTLARQAAGLLRDGTVVDSRDVVPCADLLSALVVHANPLLAELMVDKHLGELRAMSPQRRVDLGELLLSTLENGQPMAASARALGISRQTAHSRMKPLRTMLGDALNDPSQRLELTVALRAALPSWRSHLTPLRQRLAD